MGTAHTITKFIDKVFKARPIRRKIDRFKRPPSFNPCPLFNPTVFSLKNNKKLAHRFKDGEGFNNFEIAFN